MAQSISTSITEPGAREGEEPILAIRGLRNQFGAQIIHDDLDLDIYRGEIIGIVGGSGTGKSVLLRSIVGLNHPAAGQIRVFGNELASLKDEDRRAIERRWGILFQDGALFSSLSVAQNIQVPMREHLKLPQHLMDEIAALKIGLVGLDASAGPKLPSELSGGMRKRAGLARALALDPEIVFLDEPTAGLDPIGAAAFDNLILELRATLGFTVFMVTHDLDSLYTICDRVAVLAERRVLVTGSIDYIVNGDHPYADHPWIQEYFTGPRARAALAATER